MSTRNGKIALLPREIRDQLNQRLERCEESPQLLEWLNAMPEVRKVVKDEFDGVPISKQNLSQWRQGGFEEWLGRRDLHQDALDLAQLAGEMEESTEVELVDAAATVLAARFGSLLANWNGEVEEKFEAKSRVLSRLCRSLVQLQRGTHRANREKFELQCLMDEKEKAEEEEIKKRLVKPCYDMLRLPVMAKMFGGGTIGRKIAQYIQAVRRGNLDADLDLQPSDKYEHEHAKPVKSPRNSRTVQGVRKAGPNNADKPLEENEMEMEKDQESSQAESNPVKVNQTDLEPIVPISTKEALEDQELQQAIDFLEKGEACG